jgi:uncharacterized membrane protein YdbT with pleckstrin-like domain
VNFPNLRLREPKEPPLEPYLLRSERRVVSVRRHYAQLLGPTVQTLGGLFIVAYLTAGLERGNVVRDLLWYGVLALVARLVWKLATWSHDRFVVTDRRIVLSTGLVSRKVTMMPLRKVTDMTFRQSPLGRLMGYGVFVLESAGQDQALRQIDYVPSPARLYLVICDLMFGPGDGNGGDDEA